MLSLPLQPMKLWSSRAPRGDPNGFPTAFLMTEPLIIHGLTYISIKDASASSHPSTEYLVRLARTNRIRGRMLAGM
jgi:hypothetical protein